MARSIFTGTIARKAAQLKENRTPLYDGVLLVIQDLLSQAKNVKRGLVTQNKITKRTYQAIIEPLRSPLLTGYSGVELYVLDEFEKNFESSDTILERKKRKLLKVEGGIERLVESKYELIFEGDKIYVPCKGNEGYARPDILGFPTNKNTIIGYIVLDRPDREITPEEEDFLLRYGRRAGGGLHERFLVESREDRDREMVHEMDALLVALTIRINELAGYIDLLESKRSGESASESDLFKRIRSIREELERGKNLVDYLTQGIRRKGTKIYETTLRFNEVLHHFQDFYSVTGLLEGVRIIPDRRKPDGQEDLRDIEYLGHELSQIIVLKNLVQNAKKHGNATEVKIRGYVQRGRLHVHVYDNGDGVSDTDLDRMFDEVGFTTSGGGTGLALIMREIENKHGGKVYPARHAEEGGVEIHYSLPSAHYIAK